ncbi:MAG: zinc ribbon domain-containing protein [Thaumarchaeota archaeon]|nr:zinc ribbon domain-containing protein [Nitrososphaerota archaeon]|tara:strand:+ start:37 stop:564 length:528 start_codon:yes stop_codon:yes gene_type:complete
MSLGEVDTLNLLSDKLNNLFDESQDYYESFLDANNLFKQGKLTEKEFFQKLGDYVVAYSALEFLSIKVIFELKKSIDKLAGGSAPGGTQSPGLMPGMGAPGMMPGGMPATRPGTAENPVGGPASVISAGGGFSNAGTLPTPDPSLLPKQSGGKCSSCGSDLRPNAKFCTNCGNKT